MTPSLFAHFRALKQDPDVQLRLTLLPMHTLANGDDECAESFADATFFCVCLLQYKDQDLINELLVVDFPQLKPAEKAASTIAVALDLDYEAVNL